MKDYHDYVIKDGKLIGKFEDMYRDCEDPWKQTKRKAETTDKDIVLGFIKRLKVKRVLEIGCGLGYFTNRIHQLGVNVFGIDVSRTAIVKARKNFPLCNFYCLGVFDYWIYKFFHPDLIIMSDITWYMLDRLDEFLEFLKRRRVYLIHLLSVYPKGQQKYGADKFTTLDEIMDYFGDFGMNYIEWGEVHRSDDHIKTYFLAKTQ